MTSWGPYRQIGLSSRANLLLAILISLGLLAFFSKVALFIMSEFDLSEMFRQSKGLLFGSLLGGVVAHELSHFIGFRLARVPSCDIRFGMKWTVLTPFVSLKKPVTVGIYRFGLLFPLVLLGLLPFCVALALGLQGLAVWAVIMISASGGDVLLFLLTIRQRASSLVLDLPDDLGFAIID